MSIHYTVTVAAALDSSELLARITPPSEGFGFQLWLGPPRSGEHVGGVRDDGEWEWELPVATSLVLTPDDVPTTSSVENLARVVAEVLATGDEDLAFSFNGDVSLLVRQNGVVTKHHRLEWWDSYPNLDQIIAG